MGGPSRRLGAALPRGDRDGATLAGAASGRAASREPGPATTSPAGEFHGIVGASRPMLDLFHQVERVASSETTVLLHGESGTGKELVARAIHARSSRAGAAFVALNCAAVTETLQESEMFGHERGAYTGADQRRKGLLEVADGGSLFLDEVAELSPTLQAKLLRSIQERCFTRVGGTDEVASDFRIVAATHRNLANEVKAGHFREDLFFRLAVFECELPPLRERTGDLPLLTRHFLAQGNDGASPGPDLTAATLQVLCAHSWPGNVRELMNALERARVMAAGSAIRPEDLPPRVQRLDDGQEELEGLQISRASGVANHNSARTAGVLMVGVGATLADIERSAIESALLRHDGNVSLVTRELGIGRSTLYRKLKKYGIR